jgi:nitrite reductase (NO-forming)
MPALGMSDDDVANVLTYVYSNWDNAGHDVTPAEVSAVRGAGPPAGAAVSAAAH